MGDIYRTIVTGHISPLTYVEKYSIRTTPTVNHLEMLYKGPNGIFLCLEYILETEKELRDVIRRINANLATLRSCTHVDVYDLA